MLWNFPLPLCFISLSALIWAAHLCWHVLDSEILLQTNCVLRKMLIYFTGTLSSQLIISHREELLTAELVQGKGCKYSSRSREGTGALKEFSYSLVCFSFSVWTRQQIVVPKRCLVYTGEKSFKAMQKFYMFIDWLLADDMAEDKHSTVGASHCTEAYSTYCHPHFSQPYQYL